MKSVGIRYKQDGTGTQFAGQLATLLERLGARVLLDTILEEAFAKKEKLDALIAVGGDGTILHSAIAAAEQGIPILGIHAGRVGFLSSVDASCAPALMQKLIDGAYLTDCRMLLDCTAMRSHVRVLNEIEIPIDKSARNTVLHMCVYADDMPIARFAGNGLLVSTPTGSTAYSLSAGGPLALPGCDAMIITPICAHALSARPIVAPASANISIRVEEEGVALYADGVLWIHRLESKSCEIQKSSVSANFIRFEPMRFIDLLRDKLI